MLHSEENISTARGILSGSEFSEERHRKTFRAILAVQDQGIPVDVVAILNQLRRDGVEQQVGGLDYLWFLLEASVGAAAANVHHHGEVVRALADGRRFRDRLRSLAWDAEDPTIGIEETHRKVSELLEEYRSGARTGRRLAPPRSPGEILADPEPDAVWLAEGIVPAGGNVLLVGYPKSFKTYLHMELAVAMATGTPFLSTFDTSGDIRTGLVLLEGGEREQAWRIHRLAKARGIAGKDLDGLLYVWHRPPLRLSDPVAMHELGAYVADLELDLLILDAWAYASEGNSNEDFTVTPQLMALSRLRDQRPGLTTMLVHHARKGGPDLRGDRLTDLIRGSGAFGGWYDACMVLARKDEASPHVTVRTELREYPSPAAFAFTVEDDEPAGPLNQFTPQGALRLTASQMSPQTLERRQSAEAKTAAVVEFIREHPGCQKRDLRAGVTGKGVVIDSAVEMLLTAGIILDEGGPTTGMKLFAAKGAEK